MSSKAANIRYMVEKYSLKDACYVGDIEGDYRATMEAGIEFVHAAYGYGKVPQAVHSIKTFAELVNFT